MKYIKSADFHLNNTAVALGKFEGIHRGHQLLLDEIIKQKKNGLQSVVFTFDMPPGSVLKGERDYQQIYTKEERYQILKGQNIDVLIEHPFTRDFASLEPEAFVREVLIEKTGAKAVVVGTDFRFGRKRSGDIYVLKKLSETYDFQLIVIDKLQIGHEDVSSTRIRGLLEKGEMEAVCELLGRPYSVVSPVVHGKALGRTIQIPTVNQLVEHEKLVPPNGVYISRIHAEGKTFYGITNIGVKPTVEEHAVKGIETNIFDFDKDIYGQTIEVELLHYHRPEMCFSSVDKLRNQMMEDISFAKGFIQQFAGEGTEN